MIYKGSTKHKNRPRDEVKGTYCPEWTHSIQAPRMALDHDHFPWSTTVAHQIFIDSIESSEGGRYSTLHGIAFQARAANDGTWHGFPIPWIDVPEDVKRIWIENGKVTRKQIKKEIDSSDKRWALNYE